MLTIGFSEVVIGFLYSHVRDLSPPIKYFTDRFKAVLLLFIFYAFSVLGDFKNNASISLINVYKLSKADLLLKLILRYVINVFLASCQVSSL